jgi:hypothetical protein
MTPPERPGCGERSTIPGTGEEVECVGVIDHALRCLARLADGRWVSFDNNPGGSPAVIMEEPPALFRILEFKDPTQRPKEWAWKQRLGSSRSS